MDKLLNIKQVSEILNVTQKTLRIWDNTNKLKSIKTIGGHRRYKEEDIKKFVGESVIENNEILTATYSRVSSHEQKTKGDLDRQSQRLSGYCAKQKYKVEHIIKDIGSGLSDSRSGFLKLVDLVVKRKINKVVIEHKDRLTRFQFNFIVLMFKSYNVDVECVENKNISSEEEFVNDIMMLMTSFSGKLYGRISHKNKKVKEINN